MKLLIYILLLYFFSCAQGTDTGNPANPEFTKYHGPGLESAWEVDMNNKDNTFEITKTDEQNSKISLSISGTFNRLDSGYIELIVQDATGVDAPKIDTTFKGMEIPNQLFFIRELDNENNRLLTLIGKKECPTTNISSNWIKISRQEVTPIICPDTSENNDINQSNAENNNLSFYGTVSYIFPSETDTQPDPPLSESWNLTTLEEVATSPISNIMDNNICSNGVTNQSGNLEYYLSQTGVSIIHNQSSNGSTFLANEKKAIESTSLTGEYIGIYYNDHVTIGPKIKEITINFEENVNKLFGVAYVVDYKDGSVLSTENSYTFNKSSFDNKADGIIEGVIKDTSNKGSDGNIVCMVDTYINNSNKKVISCAAQSVADNSKQINIILISKE